MYKALEQSLEEYKAENASLVCKVEELQSAADQAKRLEKDGEYVV